VLPWSAACELFWCDSRLFTHFLPPLLPPGLFLPMRFLLLAGILSFSSPVSLCEWSEEDSCRTEATFGSPPSPLLLLQLAFHLAFSTLARPCLALVHLLPSPLSSFDCKGRVSRSRANQENKKKKKITQAATCVVVSLFCLLLPSPFLLPLFH
jgi:hypothetical protein